MKVAFKMVVAEGTSNNSILRESGDSLKTVISFCLDWPKDAATIYFDKVAEFEFSAADCPPELINSFGHYNMAVLPVKFRPALRLNFEKTNDRIGTWYRAVSPLSLEAFLSFWREDMNEKDLARVESEVNRLRKQIDEFGRTKEYVNELEANTSKYRKALNEVYRINGQGGPGSRRLVRQIIEAVI